MNHEPSLHSKGGSGGSSAGDLAADLDTSSTRASIALTANLRWRGNRPIVGRSGVSGFLTRRGAGAYAASHSSGRAPPREIVRAHSGDHLFMRSRDSTQAGVQALVEQALVAHRSGRLDQASALYEAILGRDPGHVDALHLLGTLCVQAGQPEKGAALLRRAVAINPELPQLHGILGVALEALGQLDDALASYDQALALQPRLVDGHYNRASALRKLGRREEALKSYDTVAVLAPRLAEAFYNRGVVLDELGRPLEASASYERAITAKPGFADALFNRGLALQRLQRNREAIDSFDRAIAARPAFAEAHFAKAQALHQLQRPVEAIASYDLSLRHRPGDPLTLACRGLSLLLAGRLAEGWPDYEWRLRTPEMAGDLRGGDAPEWKGEPLAGRVLYVHSEQGLGDTLQFVRYAPLIGAGDRVILEVQPALERLCASLPAAPRIIARGETVPPFDLHCSLLSLPAIFSTTMETIPGDTPYLAADPEAAERWRERLAALPGFKVGLAWAGGQRPDQPHVVNIDRRRSVSLNSMAPLAEVAGVTYVSLQKGPPAAQAAAPPPGMALADFTAELNDFADTAALVAGLDLVISVDTSVAHLAGALAKPVWLLNRYDTCWRWLLDRDDSPWYPTLRQFRQSKPGDWAGVMAAVRDRLREYAHRSEAAASPA